MQVAHIPDLKGFADESGRCMFLAPDERTCSIYEDRPFVCRIDDIGRNIRLDTETWHSLNLTICGVLHERVWGTPLEPEGEQCEHRARAREARTGSQEGTGAPPPEPSGSRPDEPH